MNKKLFGFLNLHYSPEIGPLTKERPMATLSFLGRYALMDFPLSNFVNSGIDQIGILVKKHQRSVNKHLGSRNTFNVNTKIGYETVMFNEAASGGSERYNTDFANIRANMYVLDRSSADYIVFAPAHFITRIDYRDVLKEHIANEAEITLIYSEVDNAKTSFIGSSIVKLNDKNEVVELIENKGTSNKANISLQSFIINRTKLIEIMNKSQAISSLFGLHDYLLYSVGKDEVIHTYEYKGFIRYIDTMENFKAASLEMLNYRTRKQLFQSDWPIYTVTHDTPPAQYEESADVQNAFVANGAYIAGKVRGSVISRNVTVEKGAVIENSIIFSNSYIGPDVHLNNVIVDKRAKVIHTKKLVSNEKTPIYIDQGDEV